MLSQLSKKVPIQKTHLLTSTLICMAQNMSLIMVKFSLSLTNSMAMISQLSEEFPVQKDTLFGKFFILYGAEYVKIMKMDKNSPN